MRDLKTLFSVLINIRIININNLKRVFAGILLFAIEPRSHFQILLNLARSIFEEQNNLECLVTKIMREAQDLLKCERCAVYLMDLNCCEAVSTHDHFADNLDSN